MSTASKTMNLSHAILLALSLAVSTAADARGSRHHSSTTSSAATNEPDESQLVEHGRYTNKKGETVHAPAHTKDGKAPAGASAKCRDGSFSFSHSRSGTCSGHRGVATWM
jgi:hypothetical protein